MNIILQFRLLHRTSHWHTCICRELIPIRITNLIQHVSIKRFFLTAGLNEPPGCTNSHTVIQYNNWWKNTETKLIFATYLYIGIGVFIPNNTIRLKYHYQLAHFSLLGFRLIHFKNRSDTWHKFISQTIETQLDKMAL